MNNSVAEDKITPFQIVLVVLSVYVLIAIFVDLAFPLPPEISKVLRTTDNLICFVFLGDFFVRFSRAERKLAFLKWGWIDFVSSIPAFDVLRFGRVVRIVRVLRLLHAFRSVRVIVSFISEQRERTGLAAVTATAILILVGSSIAILTFEQGANSNIRTADDAIWWAMATITTVGYGDKYPLTPEGRIVAAILMMAGISLFGVFTASVASYFTKDKTPPQPNELMLIYQELRSIREKLELLESRRQSSGEEVDS